MPHTLRFIRLIALCLCCGIWSACSSIPESAYYRYTPRTPSEQPSTIDGATNWKPHHIITFVLVPPHTVSLKTIDGLLVKEEPVKLGPGRHVIGLATQDEFSFWSAVANVELKPGVEYRAKAGFQGWNGPLMFFIEEKETKKRVFEAPAKKSGIKVHVYI